MPRNMLTRLAAVLALAAFLPACRRTEEGKVNVTEELDTTRPGAEMPPPTTMPAMEMTGRFQPMGNAPAGLSGTATLTRTASGDGELVVDIVGLPAGKHAWHIHSGTCKADGPVVLAITSTSDMKGVGSPLEANAAGQATQTVKIPASDKFRIDQMMTGEYSIKVYQSDGNNYGAAIACAPLTAGAGTGTAPGTMTPDTGAGMGTGARTGTGGTGGNG